MVYNRTTHVYVEYNIVVILFRSNELIYMYRNIYVYYDFRQAVIKSTSDEYPRFAVVCTRTTNTFHKKRKKCDFSVAPRNVEMMLIVHFRLNIYSDR